MTQISGSLVCVTEKPASISEVWVRAPELRATAGAVITTDPDRYPVTSGEVSFPCAPGPAVLVLIAGGMPIATVPIVVADGEAMSLQAAVTAAELADTSTVSQLEQLAAEAAQAVVDARAEADRAATALSTKADLIHTHTSSQVSDATSEPNANMVVKRDASARARFADPVAAQDAATKKYVDDRIGARLASISSPSIVYGTDSSGNQATYSVKNEVVEWSLAQRGAAGTIKVGDPRIGSDAATKKYVDDGLAEKIAKLSGTLSVYTNDSDGNPELIGYSSFGDPNTIPVRNSSGALQVAEPTNPAHAATKSYVDATVGAVSETTMTMWGATWYFTKVGRTVFVSTNGVNISTDAAWQFTSAIPTGYRPKYEVRINFGQGTPACKIPTNGLLYAMNAYYLPVSFQYLAA